MHKTNENPHFLVSYQGDVHKRLQTKHSLRTAPQPLAYYFLELL